MRVFIAIDGSKGGFEAVKQVALLLSPAQDKIALYYSPPRVTDDAGTLEEHFLDRAVAALANACFDEAKSMLPAGLAAVTETIIGKDSPSREIPEAAKNWQAELIVVGARGLGPIQRLLLGSVSRAVVHSAEVPVLVTRPRRTADAPLKVLVARETVKGVEQGAQILKQFSWPAGTQGKLLSVIQPMFAGKVPKWLEDQARSADVEAMSRVWVEGHEAERNAKVAEMTNALAMLPLFFQVQPPLVVEGHPADCILEAATQESADLLVVGTRQQGGLSRLLLGSTSETVLTNAACSVLLIPYRES